GNYPWRNWSANISPNSWPAKAATSPISPGFWALTAPLSTRKSKNTASPTKRDIFEAPRRDAGSWRWAPQYRRLYVPGVFPEPGKNRIALQGAHQKNIDGRDLTS